MKLKARFLELLGATIVAVLLSCSMSLSLLNAFSIMAPSWQCILTCTLTAVFCLFLLLDKVPAIIATVFTSGAATFALLRQDNVLEEIKQTLVSLLHMLIGGEGSLSEHSVVMVIAISVLITLICFLMTRLSGGVYPSLMLFLFVMMGSWFMEKRLVPIQIAPGLIALAALYARAHRESIRYTSAMPAAILAVAIAVMLLPAGKLTWQPLADAAAKVKDLFNDYFMFTDPRTVYSVSSDGYQPQGEILGGPATPREADVMLVKSDRLLLLRGSVRRTYTGYSWVDNSLNSRYLYVDPTRQALRDKVFDIDLKASLGDLLTETKVEIEVLSEGTSALFVPHRMKSLSVPLDLVAYYNDSGEVFITRGVQAGDRYAFTAYMLEENSAQLNRMITAATADPDEDYSAIKSGYMNIPMGLDDKVYWLTQEIIKDASTPYQKAAAIYNHLQSSEYRYNIDVDYPPSGRDFVSYFLLDSKEGYCTYYASAMAIMARLAGLPSRYIEGYLVLPDESGETVVTGENAHAWVEIYFHGIGWVPFDPTPGEKDRNNGEQENTVPPQPTPSPTPSPSPTPDRGDAGQNDDEPEITPSPTPTPTPDPQAEDLTTPTPTPEPTPPVDEHEDDEQQNKKWLKILLMLLLLLLILILIAALIYRRWTMTDPIKAAARQKGANAKLLAWYRIILTLMMRNGYIPDGGETPTAFAQRLIAAKVAPQQLLELTQAVERQQYGRADTGNAELRLAKNVYLKILSRMTQKEKMRWQMYRLTHGLGNFRQIP